MGNEIDPKVASSLRLAEEVSGLKSEFRRNRILPTIVLSLVLFADIGLRLLQDQDAKEDRKIITELVQAHNKGTNPAATRAVAELKAYIDAEAVAAIKERIDAVCGVGRTS